MKVVDNMKKRPMAKFEDIPIGQCFIDDYGNVSIKVIGEAWRLEISAVCLKDGKQWFPLDNHEFETVSASVVIVV